jgi:GT2 family glycosyltransferase
MRPPDISIVIPTWNGQPLLERFLPSIKAAAQRYIERSPEAIIEILIIDDASTDSTIDWLINEQGFCNEETEINQLHLRLRVISNKENVGFGEACNRGIALAKAPLIFLLNNDVEVDIDSIKPLVKNFSDLSVFAVHCRMFNLETKQECGIGKLGYFSRGFIRVHSSYATTNGKSALYSMFAGGGASMFDREKFLEIGGFDSLFAPFYWEDVELSYRAWKRGYTILYEPESIVYHRVSSTVRKINRSYVRSIEQRNRLIFNWISLSDKWFLISHIIWLVLLLLSAPLRLKPGFIVSFLSALSRFKSVAKRRRENQHMSRRSDKEIFQIFESIKKLS